MEWVETTGSSVEEAKEAALDELGVDEAEAEFEVLEEARSGLFGRLRQEARVRARVRPTTPRPKADRRDRRRRGGGSDGADSGESTSERGRRDAGAAPARSERGRGRGRAADAAPDQKVAATKGGSKTERTEVDDQGDSVPLEEQADDVRQFLDGLVEAFGVEGRTETEEVDEDTIEARVVGDDLGLLIGPKGQTLAAVQELARTRLMKGAGRSARLRVDVGGYRERRKEALERFTRTVAEGVLESGESTALEPMSPPDRKVVHDTVNDIEGVTTVSEGEDARRRVVIMLDDAG